MLKRGKLTFFYDRKNLDLKAKVSFVKLKERRKLRSSIHRSPFISRPTTDWPSRARQKKWSRFCEAEIFLIPAPYELNFCILGAEALYCMFFFFKVAKKGLLIFLGVCFKTCCVEMSKYFSGSYLMETGYTYYFIRYSSHYKTHSIIIPHFSIAYTAIFKHIINLYVSTTICNAISQYVSPGERRGVGRLPPWTAFLRLTPLKPRNC